MRQKSQKSWYGHLKQRLVGPIDGYTLDLSKRLTSPMPSDVRSSLESWLPLAPFEEGAAIQTPGGIVLNRHLTGSARAFYVIWRAGEAGFFSILSSILGHLDIATRLGMMPVLDMKNFPNLYSVDSVDERSGWDAYFAPLADSLTEIYLNHPVFVVDGLHPMQYGIFMSRESRFPGLWDEWMKPSPPMREYVETVVASVGGLDGTLAVHGRGGGLRRGLGHPAPPTPRQLVKATEHALERHGFDDVLLCTIESDIERPMKRRFGHRLRVPEHPDAPAQVKAGYTAFADATLLASAPGIVSGTSNVSEFAAMINGNSYAYRHVVWNGWNSTRPELAYTGWAVRSRIPSWSGGFPQDACESCLG